MADSNMDIDMDIDFSMDQEDDPEIARLQAEAAALNAQPVSADDSGAMNGVEEAQEEGEVEPHTPVPKVHIRGVNSFNPKDVLAYASEHYPHAAPTQVQWVDDSSLNLVYETDLLAAEALQAFSTEDKPDSLEVRPAKRYSAKPDVELSVRQAVVSDVKVKDARIYSRFYLDNPEYDPETKKRRYDERSRYRGRDYSGKRPRRDIGDDIYQRRASQSESFDVNLYDDDPASMAARADRRESRSSEGSVYGRKRARFEGDLMGNRENGRLRNRSASPLRDGDGRYGFNDEQPRRRTARARSPPPPRRPLGRDSRDNIGAADKYRKELFPAKGSSGSALTNGHASPPKGPKELFPNHRRHDAKDFDQEYRDVEESVGRYSLDETNGGQPRAYAAATGRQPTNRGQPRDLFSRMSGAPATKVESSYGRLQDGPSDAGFSFKGAGSSGGGFSILGASKDRVENPLVKELFPLKAGTGEKKDLFDGKIKGRASQRRRAEDLF